MRDWLCRGILTAEPYLVKGRLSGREEGGMGMSPGCSGTLSPSEEAKLQAGFETRLGCVSALAPEASLMHIWGEPPCKSPRGIGKPICHLAVRQTTQQAARQWGSGLLSSTSRCAHSEVISLKLTSPSSAEGTAHASSPHLWGAGMVPTATRTHLPSPTHPHAEAGTLPSSRWASRHSCRHRLHGHLYANPGEHLFII